LPKFSRILFLHARDTKNIPFFCSLPQPFSQHREKGVYVLDTLGANHFFDFLDHFRQFLEHHFIPKTQHPQPSRFTLFAPQKISPACRGGGTSAASDGGVGFASDERVGFASDERVGFASDGFLVQTPPPQSPVRLELRNNQTLLARGDPPASRGVLVGVV
jgi:hypothetical protein